MKASLKKYLAIFLCIILCLGAFPASALAEEEILSDIVEEFIEAPEESVPSFEAPVSAAQPQWIATDAAASVQITVDDVTAKAGAEVIVPVRISGNTGIGGLSFEISVGAGLTLTSIEMGEVLFGSISTNGNIVNWFDMNGNPATGNGVLLKLHIKVADSATGTMPVSVNVQGGKASNLTDLNSQAIPATFVAGSVSIAALPSLGDCTVNLSQTSYTYDGSAKTPTTVVKYNGATLIKGTDYTVSYSNNTNAGTATVTLTGIGGYTGSVTKDFTIAKADQNLSVSPASVSLKVGAVAQLTVSGGKTELSYSSSDESVAAVSNGEITGKAKGVATITVKAAATANYNAAEKTVSVTVREAIPEKSVGVVIDSKKVRLGEEFSLNVSFAENPGVASISGTVEYDHNALQLVSIEGLLPGTWDVETASADGMFLWANTANCTDDIAFMKLNFKVLEAAPEGEYPISITIDPQWDGIFDIDENEVAMRLTEGKVTVILYAPGDLNGDDMINNADVLRLMKYVKARGVGVELVVSGDVNGDGSINNADVLRLMKYIKARGVGVELF